MKYKKCNPKGRTAMNCPICDNPCVKRKRAKKAQNADKGKTVTQWICVNSNCSGFNKTVREDD